MASSDDSSDLSSVPSDDESLQLTKKDGILKFFSKTPKPAAAPKVEASPPRPKREPSPPHEYVLADNPDIAVSSKPLSSRNSGLYTSKTRGCGRQCWLTGDTT
jgi:hypothetical protein